MRKAPSAAASSSNRLLGLVLLAAGFFLAIVKAFVWSDNIERELVQISPALGRLWRQHWSEVKPLIQWRNHKLDVLRNDSSFFNAGSLTSEFSEVVELGASDSSPIDYLNFLNHRRMHRENSLDADSIGNFPDREAGSGAFTAQGDNDSLENLDSFTCAFNYSYMDFNAIAGAKWRDIHPHLFLFNHSQHIHRSSPWA
jgi:hypothetical protein